MVLETFSRLVTPYVQYELDDQNRMTVLNDTLNLYRYPDLTRHAEFLYSCIAETLVNDWPRQLRFLKIFDAAFRGRDDEGRVLIGARLNREVMMEERFSGPSSGFCEFTDGVL